MFRALYCLVRVTSWISTAFTLSQSIVHFSYNGRTQWHQSQWHDVSIQRQVACQGNFIHWTLTNARFSTGSIYPHSLDKASHAISACCHRRGVFGMVDRVIVYGKYHYSETDVIFESAAFIFEAGLEFNSRAGNVRTMFNKYIFYFAFFNFRHHSLLFLYCNLWIWKNR